MSIKSKIYKYAKLIQGKAPNIKVEKKVKTIWHGGESTGFAVYNQNLKNPLVYSFGVGKDVSFDVALINNYNAKVYAFDPTPKTIEWIKEQNLGENFIFNPVGLSSQDGIEQFYLPENPENISASVIKQDSLSKNTVDVPMKRLSSLLKENNHELIDLLKIDIEGSEFKVVPDILQSKIPIKQFCLEIHNRFFQDGDQKVKDLLKMLKDNNFVLVYVSDYFQELTFLNKNFYPELFK